MPPPPGPPPLANPPRLAWIASVEDVPFMPCMAAIMAAGFIMPPPPPRTPPPPTAGPVGGRASRFKFPVNPVIPPARPAYPFAAMCAAICITSAFMLCAGAEGGGGGGARVRGGGKGIAAGPPARAPPPPLHPATPARPGDMLAPPRPGRPKPRPAFPLPFCIAVDGTRALAAVAGDDFDSTAKRHLQAPRLPVGDCPWRCVARTDGISGGAVWSHSTPGLSRHSGHV